jgi:hypothetical protein
MNSRKDIILVILGALLLVAGSVVYLTPGLVAPIVPDEDGKAVRHQASQGRRPSRRILPVRPPRLAGGQRQGLADAGGE